MSSEVERKSWILKAESELRIVLQEGNSLSLRLLTGAAEIFGIELVANKEYAFADESLAIFSWYGCTLETVSDCTDMMDYDKTPMVAYVNTHAQLEAKRDVALANGDFGPVVLVAGEPDHGKSTTARILTAYACRLDRTPLFVDLDVGHGTASIPGSICAVSMDKTIMTIEDGFSSPYVSPLVYYHGHNSPKENVTLYKSLVTTMAAKVKGRLERDADARAAGIIINTCSFTDEGFNFELLVFCIKAFSADVVLVMNNDKLHATLPRALSEACTVVNLTKSGGVVARNRTVRTRMRMQRIREYFYGRAIGVGSAKFTPHRLVLRISENRLVTAGGMQVHEGMRVFGDSSANEVQLMRFLALKTLERSILAVLLPPAEDDEAAAAAEQRGEVPQSLLQSNVAGFVCVVSLDLEQDTMTVLSPCPGALPINYLLVGVAKWTDT